MDALPAHDASLHLGARALACRRGGRPLFESLDFDVRAGELVWVRGRNGSGKTSLLRLLAGLGQAESGRVLRGDARLLYLGHALALKEDLTASESLAFLLRVQGLAGDAAQVGAALEAVALRACRQVPVRALSQGQRKRLALARLAAEVQPSVWLLDEPFDALDTDGVAHLHALLQAHRARDGSVVLASHQPVDDALLQPRQIDLDAHGARRH